MDRPRRETKRSWSDRAVQNRRALGVVGERAAEQWYIQHGYEVLDRNWRCREGELDLVVANASTIVFCEVKTRSSTAYGVPAAAVTDSKQRRIRQLAMRWLDDSDHQRRPIRFDVASVMRGNVEVIQAAF